jgi:hypothetical protein
MNHTWFMSEYLAIINNDIRLFKSFLLLFEITMQQDSGCHPASAPKDYLQAGCGRGVNRRSSAGASAAGAFFRAKAATFASQKERGS